jgi:hypothetical protein
MCYHVHTQWLNFPIEKFFNLLQVENFNKMKNFIYKIYCKNKNLEKVIFIRFLIVLKLYLILRNYLKDSKWNKKMSENFTTVYNFYLYTFFHEHEEVFFLFFLYELQIYLDS